MAVEHLNAQCSRLVLRPARNETLPPTQPGQFLQVKVPANGVTFLRRPISIHYIDFKTNTLEILVRRAGPGTNTLCDLTEGKTINIMLSLGNGFPLDNIGKKVLCIGGGIGVAPLLYYGKMLKDRGVDFKYLLGGRTRHDLLCLKRFEELAPVEVATDDGSMGTHGLVTQCPSFKSDEADTWVVCGPLPMMKAIARQAKSRQINCFVSLENTMACGMGACLCCVENTTQGHKCACTDGPVFNTNELLWD